jgi:hypothetical protein
MFKFNKYDSYIGYVKRAAEARGVRVRNPGDMEKLVFFRLLSERLSGAYWLAHRELFHFGLSHKTFYITAELAQAFAESSYDFSFDELQSIRFPYPSFDVAVEPFEIEGVKVDGFLVVPPMPQSGYDAYSRIHQRFLDFCGRHDANLWMTDVKSSLSISYLVNNERLNSCINFLTHPGKSVEEVIPIIQKRQDAGVRKVVQAYFRIAIGIMLYVGLEDAERKKVASTTAKAFGSEDGEMLGASFKKGPNWHMRRACFHILSHQRFRRNPDGSPRRVWVRQCEVSSPKPMSFPTEKSEAV